MISFPRFWSHRDLVIDLPGGGWVGSCWLVENTAICFEQKKVLKEILRIMQPRKTAAATIDGSSHINHNETASIFCGDGRMGTSNSFSSRHVGCHSVVVCSGRDPNPTG